MKITKEGDEEMAQTGKVGGSGPLCMERRQRHRRRQLRPGRMLEAAWRLAQIPCRRHRPNGPWRARVVGVGWARSGLLVCRSTRSEGVEGVRNTTGAAHHASVTNRLWEYRIQNVESIINASMKPLMCWKFRQCCYSRPVSPTWALAVGGRVRADADLLILLCILFQTEERKVE